ncbi:MAG: AsmA family protein [Alphaproteobacteria bacterium]|nr:AsmA family protein [Alphaproteobacteria bacterium]
MQRESAPTEDPAYKDNREPTANAAPSRRHRGLKWTGGILGAFIVAIIALFIFFDWNMLRGPIARYASLRLHREVRIDGNLHVHLWSWTPRADVGGLRIANTKWAGGGDMADIGHLAVSVKLWPLLGGHLRLPLVQLDKSSFVYVRNLEGLSNWDFDKKTSNKPLKLPAINRFLINDGHLRIVDARKKMRFTGVASSSESTTGEGKGFVLTGDGTLNGQVFTAEVHGAPLLNVDQSKPYPFTMNVRAGYTHVTARGEIARPFDLGGLVASATFSGRDIADLYYLTGLVLPNTPAYEASAHIVRDGQIFQITGISGLFGRSDIGGDLTVDATDKKPLLTGTLRSRRVYFDDLGFLFGGGKGRKIAARAPAVTRAAAASSPGIGLAGDTEPAAQSTLLLPNAPLDVDRVRQMNADVRYRVAAIVSSDLPLRSLSVHVRLNEGVLRLDPMEAALARGSVAGHVKVDASRSVPVTNLDLRVRDVKLESLVHPVRGQATVAGPLEARAILTGTGDTVHKAASTADGSLTVVIPRGQMRKAFAELLGINLLNGGLALLTGDQEQTNIRCAVAAFQARDGVLRSQNITLDTDVERGTGNGYINLKNETLGVTLSGDAKSFRLLRLNAPITLTGSLTHPKVGVQASKALAQGGLAVALGSLINPLASLIATIDPGLAKNANCGTLLAQAKQKGAPVPKRRLAASNSSRANLRTTPAVERVARRSR